jgi:hypothetical protein
VKANISLFTSSRAFIPVSFVAANIRTHAKLVQVVSAQSTINYDGTYVVPATIDIDGMSLTPTKTRLLPPIIRKFELLHFGYVAQWETFRRAVTTNQLLCHEDTLLPRQFLFYSRFSTIDSGLVLVRGSINHMCDADWLTHGSSSHYYQLNMLDRNYY